MNGKLYYCHKPPQKIKPKGSRLQRFVAEALAEARPGAYTFPSPVKEQEAAKIPTANKKRRTYIPRPIVKLDSRPCIICLAIFTPRKSWALTCSGKCSKQHRYNLNNNRNK